MNIFKRIYCRLFQTALRVALPFLPYREPKICEIAEIPSLLREQGVRSVLLVTGRHVRGSGLTGGLENGLAENGIACAVYDNVRANPTAEIVEEAFSEYLANGCEALIAFGGGSPLDCAKAVGARAAYPKKSVRELRGLLRVRRKIPTLIAVPTTAGTGSEVTPAAVITDDETRRKYTFLDFTLIPRYAVLDPTVTVSLPPHLTASTGMDALTHAVEAYIGRSTTRETRAWALEAVTLIFENLGRAYVDGNDLEARRKLLRASYLAGLAFSKSYVGYVHAVAHSLGGRYDLPHGRLNAVLLPIVLRDYGACIEKKLRRLGIAAGVCDEGVSPREGAAAFIAAIEELNRRTGIGERIEEIVEADIPTLARGAAKEANPLYPVPSLRSAKELEKIYRAASGGNA